MLERNEIRRKLFKDVAVQIKDAVDEAKREDVDHSSSSELHSNATVALKHVWI